MVEVVVSEVDVLNAANPPLLELLDAAGAAVLLPTGCINPPGGEKHH